MNNANITWFIKKASDTDYSATNSYYYGNVNGNTDTTIYIQVWNNYQGFSDISTLENAKLIIKTINIDDSYLFDYLSVKINGILYSLTKYDDMKYGVNIGTLSGAANNGSESTQNTLGTKNKCDIELTFSAIDYKVKESIKNIVLDIESN